MPSFRRPLRLQFRQLQAVKKGIMSGFFWSHGLSWNHVRFNEHLRNGPRSECTIAETSRKSMAFGVRGKGYRRATWKYPTVWKVWSGLPPAHKGLSCSQYERNRRYLTTSVPHVALPDRPSRTHLPHKLVLFIKRHFRHLKQYQKS